MDIKLKQTIKNQLEKLGVEAVYLFGSCAENVNGKLSDIDIGILLKNESDAKNNINKLYNKLFDIFSNVFDLSNFKDIDIVFLQRATLELRFDVINHGKLLFKSCEDKIDKFEHVTAMCYMDFQPILRNFDNQILKRI